jgi:hypothetical protein
LVYDDEYNDPYDPEVEVALYVSEAVFNDPDYWLYGNSVCQHEVDIHAYGCPEGSNRFGFADFDENVNLHALAAGDIMARYSFIWDGTPGDYTFTLDLDTNYTFVVYDVFSPVDAIAFDPGSFPGGSDYFTVTLVPEPTTLLLLGLGAVVLRKRGR